MKKFFVLLSLVALCVTSHADVDVQDLLGGSGSVYLPDNTAITNTSIGVSYLRNSTTRGTNSAAFGWVESASVRSKSDGSVSDNTTISIETYPLTAGGTNTTTFVFERGDGYTWDLQTTFSVAWGPTALVATNSLITNVPTSFLQGAKYIRIKTASNNDVAGNSTNVIKRVSLNQPKL